MDGRPALPRVNHSMRRTPGLVEMETQYGPWAHVHSAWGAFRHFMTGRPKITCLIVAVLPLLLRLSLLPYLPIPEPRVHDEFSYLLGADTLASGRLANPPHPMWVHFETFHVNHQPTYATKYPPGQPLFLAFGREPGHPWYGVLLSVSLMCGCICWMLQGWLPPFYALLGSLIAVAQFGATSSWVNSYWGGAVPATGGALVLGALSRLARRPTTSASVAGALGLVILAYSRPYEGLLLSVASIRSPVVVAEKKISVETAICPTGDSACRHHSEPCGRLAWLLQLSTYRESPW